MESLNDKITAFLALGQGDSYGDGNDYRSNGSGNGCGYGYGCGASSGYGCGYDYDYDEICGPDDNYDYGIAEYDGHKLYTIDRIPTAITAIHGNIAHGFTLRNNMYPQECYIANVGGYFAHGKTARIAWEEAHAKMLQDRPIEERIARIVRTYAINEKLPNSLLYALHNTLTGSCSFGRAEFAKSHRIDVENGSMTMAEFIDLTEDAYGSENIRALKKAYQNKKQ